MVLYKMYATISISTGLYPNLDLWNVNKLQLKLQLQLLLHECNIFLACSISKVLTCFGFIECKKIQFNSIQFKEYLHMLAVHTYLA